MTGMTLQFIDHGAIGTGPSESDRRIIRSHVMRGKNAGRPRPSARKRTAIVHVKHVQGNMTSPRIVGSGLSKPGRPLLWNDLCLVSFPQQLDSEAIKVMHRCMYNTVSYIQPSGFFCRLRLRYFSQGFLTLVMCCFRPSSVRNSIC